MKNIAGAFDRTTLPRVPGRDFAGVVVQGPQDWLCAEVWGTGGDLGSTRDGSHAELLAVPVSALVCKPERLGFAEASAIGVNFVVGWLGAVETAQLDKGETMAVFGVSGGVGSAVAQIARARGAQVIGIARVAPEQGSPAASVIEHFLPLGAEPGEIGSAVKQLTGGAGADVVYDTVGGVTTPAALASLAPRGRLVVISAVGNRTVDIDLVDFYHNEVHMLGVDSTRLDAVQSELSRYRDNLDYADRRIMPISARRPRLVGSPRA